MGIKGFLTHAKVQQWYPVVGCFIGVSVFLSFYFTIKSPITAYLGLASGFYAGLLALDIWRSHNVQDGRILLPAIESKGVFYSKFAFALLGSILGLGFFVIFLIKGGVEHERVTGQSSWVTAVWGFMTFKWAFGCLMHMFHYHLLQPTGFQNV